VWAISEGRKAAAAVDSYLKTKDAELTSATTASAR